METGRCEFFSECLFQRLLCFWQAVVNPENTFYSVKRFVGRQPNEVEEELKEVSYKVDFEGQKVKIDCPVMSKKFAPEEVSAQVLRKLSADAGKYLSATVQKVTRLEGCGWLVGPVALQPLALLIRLVMFGIILFIVMSHVMIDMNWDVMSTYVCLSYQI